MIALIDDAVAARPDGLVVSFPEPGLGPAIRRAVKAGIPVITINSGSDEFRSLGVLAHVGQPEGRAGLAAGRRLARAGARARAGRCA
jgi:simple sugar transport system substrate-binding protein